MSITVPEGPAPDGNAAPLPPPPPLALESAVTDLTQEMGIRWRGGEPGRVEEYLALYPELSEQAEFAVRLIYEELCLRRELGERAAAEEYFQRFPRWRRELERILECHQLLEAELAGPNFPSPGEDLGDFRLVVELGRGLHGRVFLATQPVLADRPLVLKLTPRSGSEHLSLARLQHTHIVPLFFVQEDADRRLLILGMPYFGGATIAEIIAASDGGLRSGQHLLETLDRLHGARPFEYPPRGRARGFLARASAEQAVCWIGACLADALHYAHERGLVHLDVKSQNVLMTADGLPMLLDFHLAHEPVRAEGAAPAWLGGTPGYMSPEQRAAWDARGAGLPTPTAVGVGSDIYSLGLLLCELLGAPAPPATGMPLPLRRWDALLSVALFDIFAKCLASDPAMRYVSAADLAGDLRRQLADQPLRGVSNRSLRERWQKWRRRRPHAAVLIGLVAFALCATAAAVVAIGLHFGHQQEEASRALELGRRLAQNRQYDEALAALRRGQQLASGLAGTRTLAAELTRQINLVEQAGAADELHRLAERVRFLSVAEQPPAEQLRPLEARIWDLWQRREEVRALVGGDGSPDATQRVKADLLDLAILWTDLHVRLAVTGDSRSSFQEALNVLGEAEGLFGPSPALLHRRKAYAQALGLTELARAADRRAADVPARTAWEHYSLGWSLLRAEDFQAASPHFDRAIELKPREFWAHYYKGLCAYRLHRFQDAVLGFSGCVLLAPEAAEVYFNRALAFSALGNSVQALRDYDRALELEPTLAPAALNRGLLHFREKRFQPALRDLEVALRHGAVPAVVHYNEALVHQALNDRTSALASLQAALQANPQHREAQLLREKLLKQR
jgi:serine/threonine protein kinase/Flp pilus assembly protein TadD